MRGNRETLSGLHVWGLAFGTIIGFGAFVLPADTYLPAAGPLGTIIAIIPAVIAMLIIAGSFQYMMIRYPGRGGAFLYTLNLWVPNTDFSAAGLWGFVLYHLFL